MVGEEDYFQCRDTVVRCIRWLDDKEFDKMAECFLEDGVWERAGQSLVGPAAVRAAMATRPANLQTQHLISNMIVDAQDETATVRYTLTGYAQMGDEAYHLHGIFKAEDQLRHTVDGWRFALRTVAPAFSLPG